MKKIKLAQIGVGHNHAAEKMRTARRMTDLFEVVGVAEPDKVWIEKRGGQECYQGIPFLGVEELLDTPGLEAVLIETDIPDLLPIARACVDRGLHVHMDKPAGTDLEAYRAILRDAKAKGLVFNVGYMFRGNAAARDCLRRARSGELGEVYHMDAQLSHERTYEYRDYMRAFPKGNLYIFGCHMVDMVTHVMGAPEQVVSFTHETGKDDLAVTDNSVVNLIYSKGTSLLRASSVEVNGWGRRQVFVAGERGSIEIKPLENPTVYSVSRSIGDAPYDNRNYEDFESPKARYEAYLDEFARIIRGEMENEFSYEHEYLVQLVSLAACGIVEYEKPGENFEL